MNASSCQRFFRTFPVILLLVFFTSTPVIADDYLSLDGVQSLKTVFDYTQGSPEMATVVFPAIRQVYTSEAVTSLPNQPITAIVFHGPAVKLITTSRGDDPAQNETLDKVAAMIRQFKKDGVRMAVCMYAVEALGVDPATLMPEIDRVPNGFVSVSGYQQQGFSLVAVP